MFKFLHAVLHVCGKSHLFLQFPVFCDSRAVMEQRGGDRQDDASQTEERCASSGGVSPLPCGWWDHFTEPGDAH